MVTYNPAGRWRQEDQVLKYPWPHTKFEVIGNYYLQLLLKSVMEIYN